MMTIRDKMLTDEDKIMEGWHQVFKELSEDIMRAIEDKDFHTGNEKMDRLR